LHSLRISKKLNSDNGICVWEIWLVVPCMVGFMKGSNQAGIYHPEIHSSWAIIHVSISLTLILIYNSTLKHMDNSKFLKFLRHISPPLRYQRLSWSDFNFSIILLRFFGNQLGHLVFNFPCLPVVSKTVVQVSQQIYLLIYRSYQSTKMPIPWRLHSACQQ